MFELDFKDEPFDNYERRGIFLAVVKGSVASKERTSADKDTDTCRCVSEKCKQPSEARV